jgi:hypothetical protein
MCAGTVGRLACAVALLAALGLAGCSDIDNALFGADEGGAASGNAPGTLSSSSASTQASAEPAAAAPSSAPDTSAYPADTAPQPGTIASQAPAAVPASGAALISPIRIEPGVNTGTGVSNTIAGLRAQMVTVGGHVGQNAQRLAGLRAQNAQASSTYQEAKAHITARLQAGTTRGNPELVAQWNSAQAALDLLTTNINAMGTLGTEISGDASAAHATLDQIGQTLSLPGAVDEDHRQLSVLEDETRQTIVVIERLLRDVSDNVRRQTTYVANERANLTALAGAIKNGELYGAGDAPGPVPVAFSNSSEPLVVIRFDRPNVDYQQILYAALNQALQSRPQAAFAVVAVAPTRGSVAAVQSAQTAAKRHAQDVMRSIADMGVPASRLAVASATDPNATASEVRVFVR